MKSFGSDNYSGVHPLVLESIVRANTGYAPAYGNDPLTASVLARFRQIFGAGSETFLVLTGTGANILGLASILRSYQAVLCSSFSHICYDECGGPETFTGAKLIPIAAEDAKLAPALIEPYLSRLGDVHGAQPRVVSITQPTEYGAVYHPDEVRSLADFAHRNGLLLHMDGARLSNACATLGIGLRAATADLGVDVLSFGGTKNGLLCGEAVVFFSKSLAAETPYFRKKLAQLASKMRFIAAQFDAYLDDDRWLQNALQANSTAKRLEQLLREIPAYTITRPVEANMLFFSAQRGIIERLRKVSPFYLIDESRPEARLVTSFDTTEEDVVQFAEMARLAAEGGGGSSVR